MATYEDFTSFLEQLKLQPSTFLWELEIRNILAGKREHRLIKLGGAQEYVDVILEESRDEALSSTTFNEALRNVIQSWQPSRPETAAFFSCMLDLISAYTPQEGFIKVLGFISRGKYFGENVTTSDSRTTGKDLHFKALVTLQYYYPAAPPAKEDENLGFRQYVDSLQKHLQHDGYRAYALRRLYELNLIDISDVKVAESLTSVPELVSELVSAILKSRNRFRIESDLSLLYTHCLRLGDGGLLFERALEVHGARLAHEDVGPLVYFGAAELILLTVAQEVEEAYMLLRWEVGQKRGMVKLEGLVSLHSELIN